MIAGRNHQTAPPKQTALPKTRATTAVAITRSVAIMILGSKFTLYLIPEIDGDDQVAPGHRSLAASASGSDQSSRALRPAAGKGQRVVSIA